MEPARGDTRKVIRSVTSSGLAGRPSGMPPSGTLRINTLGMAARQVIAPRLGRFHRAFPDVPLDIVVDDGLGDIVAGRFDAGIRVGARLEKDMIAVRLTPDVKMVAVAASGPLVTNHSDIGVAAALQGLGIACAFDRERVDEYLAQGQLVQVLADWSITRPGLFIYYSNRHHPAAVLGAFIDCLLDRDLARPAPQA